MPTRSDTLRKAREAISDLFLDSELDEEDFVSINRRLRETGLSWEELDRIYAEEVAPAVYKNLRIVPGGVWGAFNIDELESKIDKNEERIRNLKRNGTLWKIYSWWISRETKEYWARIQTLFSGQ